MERDNGKKKKSTEEYGEQTEKKQIQMEKSVSENSMKDSIRQKMKKITNSCKNFKKWRTYDVCKTFSKYLP